MTHLMRKHGKVLLAVLGAFLMITFTLPTMFSGGGDVRDTPVGQLQGKPITTRDVMVANDEISLLQRFGILGVPYGPRMPSAGVLSLDQSGYLFVPLAYYYEAGSSSHDTERGTHWILMLREAAKYGIIASDADVTDVIASMHLTETDLTARLHAAGVSQMELRACIAHGLMIRNLALLAMRGTQVAVPQLEFLMDQVFSKVQVQYAAFDGAQGIKSSPSQDQIQKQFDAYKDVVASTTPDATPPTIDGHTYPFGYKYPDRVKVEYLKFNRNVVAAHFQPTREDLQAAYRYYTEHPDEFHPKASTTTPNATQPAPQSFDDVRDRLVKAQVDDRIDRFMKKATDQVLAVLGKPWAQTTVDATGFRDPLPRDKWADYKAAANAVQVTAETGKYVPQYAAIDQWQGPAELAKQPGIGEAYYEDRNGRYTFADLATHVKELSESKSLPRLFLQTGIDGPVLQDGDGNLYIYRVTATDKSHDPASVDEVRPQVIADLQKLSAYEHAQAEAKKLAETVSAGTAGDLQQLGKLRGLDVKTTPEITRREPEIPGLGTVPGFTEAAFNLARNGGAQSQPATRSANKGTPATTVNDDATLKVYVLALGRYTPVSPQQYAEIRPQALVEMQQDPTFLQNWINLDALSKRLHYVPAHPFSSKDEG